MRKCRNCKRETGDDHETICVKCGWLTDPAAEPVKHEEKRVNISRHREQLSQRD